VLLLSDGALTKRRRQTPEQIICKLAEVCLSREAANV
jgi:hypothetical protein